VSDWCLWQHWWCRKQIIVNTGLFLVIFLLWNTSLPLELFCWIACKFNSLLYEVRHPYSCYCGHKVGCYLGLLIPAIRLDVLHSLWGKDKNRQYVIRAINRQIFLGPRGLDVRVLEQATDWWIKWVLETAEVFDCCMLFWPSSTKPCMQTELSTTGHWWHRISVFSYSFLIWNLSYSEAYKYIEDHVNKLPFICICDTFLAGIKKQPLIELWVTVNKPLWYSSVSPNTS